MKSTEDDQQLFTRGTAHLVLFDGVLDQTLGFAYTKFNQRDFDPNPPTPEPTFFNGDRVKIDWQGEHQVASHGWWKFKGGVIS